MSHAKQVAQPYNDLKEFADNKGTLNVVIDTPRGSRCKYRYDPQTGLFKVAKLLPLGASFPYNFGFIPSTDDGAGDFLDVMIMLNEPLEIGTVAPVYLIGVLEARQTDRNGASARNDRFLGVISTQHNPPECQTIEDVDPQHLYELEHFFISYNEIHGKLFCPIGRCGPAVANKLVQEGIQRHAGVIAHSRMRA